MTEKLYSAYDRERHYPAAKGEETGMVWCPQRLSGIAEMRCAEYQKQFLCGIGCAGAVKRARAAELNAALKFSENNLSRRGFAECVECGEAKKNTLAPYCRSCGQTGRRYRKRIRMEKDGGRI